MTSSWVQIFEYIQSEKTRDQYMDDQHIINELEQLTLVQKKTVELLASKV